MHKRVSLDLQRADALFQVVSSAIDYAWIPTAKNIINLRGGEARRLPLTFRSNEKAGVHVEYLKA